MSSGLFMSFIFVGLKRLLMLCEKEATDEGLRLFVTPTLVCTDILFLKKVLTFFLKSDRQADGQANEQTDEQADYKKTGRRTSKRTNRRTSRQADGQADEQTDGQADRQTDR
jgi:hypothetical protein